MESSAPNPSLDYNRSVPNVVPFPVVLASASPRRHELLKRLIPNFEIAPANIDEDSETEADPYATAEKLAILKAKAVAQDHPHALVIGADTVVALPTESGVVQLAKPADASDACRMLALLSGQTHLVITGIALVWPGGTASSHETSRVTFRGLDASEIAAYVATGEPMDKAGAYAVQAGGGTFIERIEGSRSNVIGLPMPALARLIQSALGVSLDVSTIEP
jgi:septum formation protein